MIKYRYKSVLFLVLFLLISVIYVSSTNQSTNETDNVTEMPDDYEESPEINETEEVNETIEDFPVVEEQEKEQDKKPKNEEEEEQKQEQISFDVFKPLLLKASGECIESCGRVPSPRNINDSIEYQFCIADCHPKIDFLHQTLLELYENITNTPVSQDGYSCWDLNQNLACDMGEDVNDDGFCSTHDCLGPRGEKGNVTVVVNNIMKSGCERPKNLELEISDVISSSDNFAYIGPITMETDVIDYKSGDDSITRKRPGRTNTMSFEIWVPIVSSEAADLFNWHMGFYQGFENRVSGSIIVNDDDEELFRYNFFEAWPSKLETPVIDQCTGETIEKYTIVLEKLERT